jgi:hypothetical protein
LSSAAAAAVAALLLLLLLRLEVTYERSRTDRQSCCFKANRRGVLV